MIWFFMGESDSGREVEGSAWSNWLIGLSKGTHNEKLVAPLFCFPSPAPHTLPQLQAANLLKGVGSELSFFFLSGYSVTWANLSPGRRRSKDFSLEELNGYRRQISRDGFGETQYSERTAQPSLSPENGNHQAASSPRTARHLRRKP